MVSISGPPENNLRLIELFEALARGLRDAQPQASITNPARAAREPRRIRVMEGGTRLWVNTDPDSHRGVEFVEVLP